MAWIDRTTFNPDIKNWSYSKIVEAFGEKRGALVADKFGVSKRNYRRKKSSYKTTTIKAGEEE